MTDWAEFLRQALASKIAALGTQRRPLVLDELCSGMCTGAYAMEAVGSLRVEARLTADPKPAAIKFTRCTGGRSRHHFLSMADVLTGKGHCAWHSQECEVPVGRSDMLVAGVPCKPFSAQRSGRFKTGAVEVHRDFNLFFDEVVDAVHVMLPHMGVLENVPGMGFCSESEDRSWAERAMQRIVANGGYHAHITDLDLTVWAAVRRRRLYILLCDKVALQRTAALVEEIHAARAHAPPVTMEQCLVAPSDVTFLEFLQRWSRKADNRVTDGGDSWKRQVSSAREALKAAGCVGYRSEAWTDPTSAPRPTWGESPSMLHRWRGTPTAPVLRGVPSTKRARELLNVAFLKACESEQVCTAEAAWWPEPRRKVARSLFVDVSQAVTRSPWAKHALKTVTTTTELYSFERDTMVEPEELLRLHGRPVPLGHSCEARELRDLLGNCMAVQTLATVMRALFLSAGQWLPGGA